MAFSTYLANLLLDSTLGQGSFPPLLAGDTPATPPNLYVALFTVAPAADGTGGTEVSGTAYARAAVAQNSTNWPAASGGSKSNGAAISFGTAGGAWGTVSYFGIYDALTSGNLLYFGPLSQPMAIASGDAVQCAAGSIAVALA